MKFRILFSLFFALSVYSAAQPPNYDKKLFRYNFEQGNMMILEQFYDTALNTFLYIYKMDTSNANVAYKIGFLYLQSSTDKAKAIPYLEQANRHLTKKYVEFEPTEKNAPQIAMYYLAIAYHLDYKFDDAIALFEKYKTFISAKNSDVIADLNHRIDWCKNGKELTNAPVAFIITDLGDSVNSAYPDYSPVITADESILMFTSRRQGVGGLDNKTIDDQFYEDIWVCYKKPDGSWTKAQSIGLTINTLDHEATIGLSADGQQLFIYKDDKGDGNVYVSELNGNTFSVPEKVGTEQGDITDINTNAWEPSACVSADGTTLYFISDRIGGFGGRDIYKCVKLPNGRWSKALNLGPAINTPYDEDAPFIHPDGKTLFFSSKGHKSMGGFDIFFSSKTDTGWTPPQNMGYPMNTTDDDIFYVMSTDGRRAYFSSYREGGKGEKDIYMALVPYQLSEPVALMIFYIKNGNGDPIDPSIVMHLTSEETGETKDFRPVIANGKTTVTLPPGKNYTMNIEINGGSAYSENLKTPFEDFTDIQKENYVRTIILGELLTSDTTQRPPDNPPYKDTTKIVVVKKDTTKYVVVKKDTVIKKTPDPYITQPLNGKVKWTDTTNANYAFNFTYKQTKVKTEAPEFTKLIDQIINELNTTGSVKIFIASCASQVPIGTGGQYKTNGELALGRAVQTEVMIITALKARGIDMKTAKIKFTSNYKVAGPDYRSDYIENRSTYENWQYVKVYLLPYNKMMSPKGK